MRVLLILFAKAPLPGHVKTRLMPRLSALQAAGFHDACVRDSIALLKRLPNADLELHTDTRTDAWIEQKVTRSVQSGRDLGARMRRAFERAHARGRDQVLIVGSDAPTVPLEQLQELIESRADVSLGPAEDGGYYAIACRRTSPAMFDEVRWSTAEALADTQRSVTAAGLSIFIGRPWYDIDTYETLQRLATGGATPHVAEWLRRERL